MEDEGRRKNPVRKSLDDLLAEGEVLYVPNNVNCSTQCSILATASRRGGTPNSVSCVKCNHQFHVKCMVAEGLLERCYTKKEIMRLTFVCEECGGCQEDNAPRDIINLDEADLSAEDEDSECEGEDMDIVNAGGGDDEFVVKRSTSMRPAGRGRKRSTRTQNEIDSNRFANDLKQLVFKMEGKAKGFLSQKQDMVDSYDLSQQLMTPQRIKLLQDFVLESESITAGTKGLALRTLPPRASTKGIVFECESSDNSVEKQIQERLEPEKANTQKRRKRSQSQSIRQSNRPLSRRSKTRKKAGRQRKKGRKK